MVAVPCRYPALGACRSPANLFISILQPYHDQQGSVELCFMARPNPQIRSESPDS